MNDSNGSTESETGAEFALIKAAQGQIEEADKRSGGRPQQIGRYRILGTLGQGGMGVVYRAEQDKPQREVALKVVRADATTPGNLRRLETEGQILARLQHPGIAQIYEAGIAETKRGPRPFFAMELIKGKPLIAYAEGVDLGLRPRLELLAKICDAVQHAHQKGIIHRDLKPGNIIVDEDGQPKILDFGVARVTDADVQATTLHTGIDQLLGTIPYMSPEQVQGDSHDLDTRSDVYSVGVVGYELLTGQLPYDIARKPIPEAVRAIRDDDAKPLSSVNKVFRGDIETIINGALLKDRDRRYQAASDLAADIRRYMADEPIVKHPPSVWYYVWKFTKRNRVLTASAAAVLVVLLLGLGGTLWQAGRATTAEQQARKQLQTATLVSELLQEGLTSIDPNVAKGKDTTVLAGLLETIEVRLDDEPLRGQPEVRATLHHTLGKTYAGLGLYDKAESHLESAVNIRRKVLGAAHRETLGSMLDLAATCNDDERYDQGVSLADKVWSTRRLMLGPDHRDTLDACNILAIAYDGLGRLGEAEQLLREVLEVRQRVYGDDDPGIPSTKGNLAGVLAQRGNVAEAEQLASEAFEAHERVWGIKNFRTLRAGVGVAHAQLLQSQYEEAEELMHALLPVFVEVFGEEHPDTLLARRLLTGALLATGDPRETEAFIRKTLDIQRRVLGDGHRDTLNSINELAHVLRAQGKPDKGASLLKEAVELAEEHLPLDHWLIPNVKSNYGAFLTELQELEEAEAQLLTAHAAFQELLGSGHQKTELARQRIISLYEEWGKPEEAAEYRAQLPREVSE